MIVIRSLALAVAACLWAAAPALAQNFVFQQPLPGTSNGAQFGISTAVQGDVAVIGAPRTPDGGFAKRGVVYVLARTGNTWTPRQTLTAADTAGNFEEFGTSVAISGNTIVVGAPGVDVGAVGSNHGAAYVFVSNGVSWVQQSKLTASNAQGDALFGERVAIDGNFVVVGARRHDLPSAGDAGAAYLFERNGTTWTQQALPVADIDVGDGFGSSVGISGQTACVGAPLNGTGGIGAVYVYTRGVASWSLQQKLLAPDGQSTDFLGYSCAVDGNTVVGGASGVNGAVNFQGAAYVFVRSGSIWSFQQKLTPSVPEANSFYGRSAMVLKGSQLAIGAAGSIANSPHLGSVYVYDRDGASWTERQRIVPPPGAFPGVRFGAGIGLDGNALLVGASCDGNINCPGAAMAYASGVTTPTAPGAPTNFVATVAGNIVTMSWGAPDSGGTATGYTILARVAPGGPVVASLPVGAATNFGVTAPNGTFIVSVQAANALGAGPESAAVTVTTPQVVPAPGPPTAFAAAVAGNAATFTWAPASTGGPVTGYLLVAGTTPGFAIPVASLPLPAVLGTTVPGIPPGTYYARLLAMNPGGTSPPSNEVTVTVLGLSAPAAPTLHPATVSGRSVLLQWTPGIGGVSTSYLLTARVAGAPGLVAPIGGGQSLLVHNVPSGTYFVTIAGVNAGGTGPVSNEITFVVP